MQLLQLLERLDCTHAVQDCEISGVTNDSREAGPGMVFVCVKGGRFDGHDHAESALAAGATAVVCTRDLGLPTQILCADTRQAFALLCAAWYGYPSESLKLVGVTGTNGKTTITMMVKHILEAQGHQVGLVGTLYTQIGDLTLPARHTTPGPHILQSILRRMVNAGCEYAVMECSSHALDQQRIGGLHFQAAAFSNLTQDHLDYHGTMENYFQAKKKLFSMCARAVFNMDDAHGRRLAKECTCPAITFSAERDEADYVAKDLRCEPDSTRFQLVGPHGLTRISLPMPGMFSVSNALAALGLCLQIGLSPEEAAAGLATCPGVPGRIEVLPCEEGYTIIRDYAHSPDGLEKIISAMRMFAKGRVVTLFGCAGNRDRTKRKLMGEIVARLSDFVILTSDNPRDEDEMQIIGDAMPGLLVYPDTPHEVIADRYAAIQWALEHARPEDILILAGKGHEDYQVLHGETICFDEKEIVAELLEKRRAKRD